MSTLHYSLLCCTLMLAACSSSKNKTSSTTTNTPYVNTTPTSEDCYYPRKTIISVTDAVGKIAFVADTYLITNQDGTKRYQPCELPTRFSVEGMAVQYSGDKLEINPGERRIASPFRLQNIRQVP